MNHYAFILGREALLSLAELVQVFRAHNRCFELVSWSTEIAIFAMEEMDKKLFDSLGGCIKFGSIKATENIESIIEQSLPSFGKFNFGISIYSANQQISREFLRQKQKSVVDLGLKIKRELKNKGISARFVTSKEDRLSSVVVQKNRLLSEKGIEVLVGVDKNKTWVGKTEFVQDFQAFSGRDYSRPARDDVSGMLPPKLARLMINLVGQTLTDKVLLDPFCGSGTILQEAVLLGVKKVFGGDISEKAVSDTLANLGWLKGKQSFNGEIVVDQVDVKDIGKWLPKESVDLVVTEPYLGEPVRGALTSHEIRQRQKFLSEFYGLALSELAKVLKTEGRLVMVFPFIGQERIPLPAQLYRHWEIIEPLEGLALTVRGGLDYRRPGQKLGREVFVLRKIN